MKLSTWEVRVQLRHRKSPSSVWESNTRDVFYTSITAQSSVDAMRIACSQYGGPDKCIAETIREIR